MGALRYRSAWAGLLVLHCSLGAASVVWAEPSAQDSALATLLFEQGRALIAAGQIPEACQKLAESQRLDPGGGTLLNLARCHELEGRLASAWSEFQVAQLLARNAGRSDRDAEAAVRISALEPRLSRLNIVVPPAADLPGLVVEQDGRELGRGAWSTEIPIDGGEHVVRATAPGREPFTLTVVVASELERRTVEIPTLALPAAPPAMPAAEPLAALPATPAVLPPLAAPASLQEDEEETFTPARLRWLGVGSAALGLVAWTAGGVALAAALRANDAAEGDCFVDGCGPTGLRQRNEAVSRGNLATALGIGGALLVGTGVTLFYLGHRSPLVEARSPIRLRVSARPGAAEVALVGGL